MKYHAACNGSLHAPSDLSQSWRSVRLIESKCSCYRFVPFCIIMCIECNLKEHKEQVHVCMFKR